MTAPFSSIRFVRYAPAGAIAAHVHPEPSLCLVLAGEYRDTVRGRSVDHGRGGALFCPAHEPHSQAFGAAGAYKLQLGLTASALDYLSAHLRLSEAPFTRSTAFATLGRRIAAEMAVDDPFAPIVVEGLSHELLGLFGRGAREAETGPAWLKAAHDYMADHLDAPVSVADLAAVLGQPPVRLSRAFRRLSGRTIGEHQRRLRIARAVELLAASRMPLSEVAQACGFCDQSHLTRAFKAEVGCTPAAFRRGS